MYYDDEEHFRKRAQKLEFQQQQAKRKHTGIYLNPLYDLKMESVEQSETGKIGIISTFTNQILCSSSVV